LTNEGELSAHLGIDVDHDKNKRSVDLTQPRLIQRIIEEAGLTDANPRKTPACSTMPLTPSRDLEPHIKPWHYASMIGMLMYLTNNTRPVMVVAVHQAAYFTVELWRHHPIPRPYQG
jgi:hypothetical protein